MPRGEVKKGSVTWTARPHPLSEKAKKKLLSRLGFDLDTMAEEDEQRAINAMNRVAVCLGRHPGEKIARKTLLRLGTTEPALLLVKQDAQRFKENLRVLPARIQAQLANHRAGLVNLDDSLTGLIEAVESIEAILEKQEEKEPKHRQGTLAERRLILELREVFVDFYQGQASERKQTGAVILLSENEEDELEFIQIALEDAQFPASRKKILSMLKEPDMAVLSERRKKICDKSDKTLDRITEYGWPDSVIDLPDSEDT